MKICIIGSRSIDKAEFVIPILDRFMKDHVVGTPVILSGGAKGVDQITKSYAKANNINLVEFLPYHLIDNRTPFSSKYFFFKE